MKNYVGCSGYSYDGWAEGFYPPEVPKKRWLEYYAEHFDTVEINSSFYHLPKESTLKKWHQGVPGNFRFTLKGSRYVTHQKKLNDVRDAVRIFYDAAGLLKGKLACILWQLPGNLHKNLDKLESFCKTLSDDFRNVIEFRHNSWFGDDTSELLRHYGVAFCVISAPDGLSDEAVKTTNRVYIRFHGIQKWYDHDYRQVELEHWANKLKALHPDQIYAYFNNDINANAPRNAAAFMKLVR